jgi:copper chaperone CopZ
MKQIFEVEFDETRVDAEEIVEAIYDCIGIKEITNITDEIEEIREEN